LAVLFTGVGTGIGAAALTRLLEVVQHFMWPGSDTDILSAAERASPWHHVVVLLGRGTRHWRGTDHPKAAIQR